LDAQDVAYLEQAWRHAEKGRGSTSPNPVVGAVVVKDGVVLGEGWHVGPGRDHAEVAAIKDAVARANPRKGTPLQAAGGEAARAVCEGGTMYVTLEPCCTYGRTPPCTEALTSAGLARVVAGAIDPTPSVNGKGLELLRRAGLAVEVAEGALAHKMKRQNDGLRKTIATGLPFVTYKYAMTADGRVATDAGDSRWISGPESRAMVHQWRAWSDAVVVGAGTATVDDPELTVRHVTSARAPLRVVIDGRLSLDPDSKLAASTGQAPVLVMCGRGADERRRAELEARGVEIEQVAETPDGRLDPAEVCRRLAVREVQYVLLEGGPTLAGGWWAAGMIDKVATFICPMVVSGEQHRGPLRGTGVAQMDAAVRLQEVEIQRSGDDILMSGYVKGTW
jgi:diaminohydroxyphosphoribosylaminopyrimidine deaminase/5-amino-6-(5-phosphoribosylamino)uracil reductase